MLLLDRLELHRRILSLRQIHAVGSTIPASATSWLTGGPVEKAFVGRVLGKYGITYFRCLETGLLQTEEPYWLEEAYSSAISVLDVGYVQRNLECAEFLGRLLMRLGIAEQTCLDYGGGYGMLVRMMRDRGYHFLREERFCENLFAKGFDVGDHQPVEEIAVVTMFEVLEHVTNPVDIFRELTARSPIVVFSTEIQPNDRVLQGVDEWRYFVPESGQHVAFYTIEALEWIARKLNCHLTTNGRNYHIFSRSPLPPDLFETPVRQRSSIVRLTRSLLRRLMAMLSVSRRETPVSRKSLLMDDYHTVLRQLRSEQSIACESSDACSVR